MPRIYKQQYAFSVDYICDECEKGYLRPTKMALLSNPPQYPHKCSNCGATENLKHTYPTIEFRDKPEIPNGK